MPGKRKGGKKGPQKKPENIIPIGSMRNPDAEDIREDEEADFSEMPFPRRGISTNDMSRFHRIIEQEIETRGLETPEEVNAFLEKHMTGRTIDEIVAGHDMTAEEEARAILEESDNADEPEEILEICVRALSVYPMLIEAKVTLAMVMAEDAAQAVLSLKTVIIEHENMWGREFMEEHRGHFWGVHETRSYMMARAQLVQVLVETGFFSLAAREIEEMLDLNPDDNQGMRDILRGLYIAEMQLEKLGELNQQFADGDFAVPLWSRVFHLYFENRLEEAEAAARKAHEQNPHVAAYLTGRKKAPEEEPPGYQLGSPEEAQFCYQCLEPACFFHEDFVSWLKSLKGLSAPRKKSSRKRKK
jgi:hypothetical protein